MNEYYIWLSQCFAYGSDKPKMILEEYSDIEEFYNGGVAEFEKADFLTKEEIAKMTSVSLSACQEIAGKCSRLNIDIVAYNDDLYPERLRDIFNPPSVLYVKGDIGGLDERLAFTVVGTRSMTDYSKKVTGNLSYQLAKAGAVIISGCASGLDTYAHMGALKAGGTTIAVLACGLDVNYPAENRELKQQILKHGGALISELPPSAQTWPSIIPVRNRIMAALGTATVVTHAPVKSGSLITANHALEMGKDVFCVPPHDIYDEQYTGVNRLILDGAWPALSANDMLQVYISEYAHNITLEKPKEQDETKAETPSDSNKNPVEPTEKPPQKQPQKPPQKQTTAPKKKPGEKPPAPDDLSSDERAIYDILTYDPIHINQLTEKSGLTVPSLLSALTNLEVRGLLTAIPGKKFMLYQE
ncbi:MAG: DNA-processing protein DprA [Oscillospiraceae bacterium]|nr:DNA-processing protein DprA [Oscillospiraceae bacterium]